MSVSCSDALRVWPLPLQMCRFVAAPPCTTSSAMSRREQPKLPCWHYQCWLQAGRADPSQCIHYSIGMFAGTGMFAACIPQLPPAATDPRALLCDRVMALHSGVCLLDMFCLTVGCHLQPALECRRPGTTEYAWSLCSMLLSLYTMSSLHAEHCQSMGFADCVSPAASYHGIKTPGMLPLQNLGWSTVAVGGTPFG